MAKGNKLYKRLAALGSSVDSGLLLHVLRALPADVKSSLRLANKQLCAAVSNHLEHAWWNAAYFRASLARDMSRLFPAARRLSIVCCDVPATDVCGFLQSMAASNPVFLEKIFHVDIYLCPISTSTEVQAEVLHILARCPSLTTLQVTCEPAADWLLPSHCHFTGHGATPAARRASMQRQLAAITASPAAFLAPASWPTHSCLTAVQIPSTELHLQDWLPAALKTQSLASLYLFSIPELDWATCEAIRSLSRLTRLSIQSPQPPTNEASREAFASTLASTPSLVALELDGTLLSRPADDPDAGTYQLAAAVLPSSWSQLSNLTSLTLSNCSVRLASVPAFPALRHLDLGRTANHGCLLHLTALTALTSWVDGRRREPDVQGEDGAALAGEAGGAADDIPLEVALTTRLPQGWVEGFEEFRCWRGADMAVFSQLTALTRMELLRPELCPQLFRGLACLPKLNALALTKGTFKQDDSAHQAPAAARPVLPSLDYLSLTIADGNRLGQIISWVDVPRLRQLDCHDAGPRDPWFPELRYSQDWGAGWLRALFAGIPTNSLTLFFKCDSDVTALGQELAAPAGWQEDTSNSGYEDTVKVALGKDVSVAGFRALLQVAHHLPLSALHVVVGDGAMLNMYPPNWGGVQQLPRGLVGSFAGMEGPCRLRLLTLDGCSLMEDGDVQALAAAMPDLAGLHLEAAEQLGDEGLAALVACQHLASVHVADCPRITAAGVALLLSTAPQLYTFELGVAHGPEFVAAVYDAAQALAAQPLRVWHVRQLAGGLCFQQKLPSAVVG